MNIRKPILVILTLLTLAVAGFAVAQTNTPDPATTGTMDHSMEQGTSANDTANNPSVQTVTGLVVSFDNSHLVVRTSEGEKTFNVVSNTVHPATMQANLPVVVEFVTESGGDRAVRVQENTHASAADQTPGGSVTGNTEWPGAANKGNNDANAAAGATGSAYDQGTTGSTGTTATGSTGTTGSTYDQGTTSTTTTTGTGTTGSTYDSGTTGSTTDTTGSMSAQDTTDTSSTAGTTETATGYQGSSLPKTGSDLPLTGLLGLTALALAAGLRFARNA